MAESVGLLASLLSPGAARESARQQQLKNILSTANSSNPLLAEAGKTAGMFSQALGRTLGRDMRSEQEKSAERISSAVQAASGDTLYAKLITAAQNPSLSVSEKYTLVAQAEKIKPEPPAPVERENFLNPATNQMFPGVLLPSGAVRNLQTGELVSGALKAGQASIEKPAEPKTPEPVEIQPFTEESLSATIETSPSIKSSIEGLAQEPRVWSPIAEAFGFDEQTYTKEATYDNMKVIIERKAREIQRQIAEDPQNPRSISEAEALQRAITAIKGGDITGITSSGTASNRDRFSNLKGD